MRPLVQGSIGTCSFCICPVRWKFCETDLAMMQQTYQGGQDRNRPNRPDRGCRWGGEGARGAMRMSFGTSYEGGDAHTHLT